MQNSQDTHVSNKKLYPNFARTNPQHSTAALKILSFVKANGLKRVSIVQQEGRKWASMRRYLSRLLRSKGVKIAGTHKLSQMYFHFDVPEAIYTTPLKSQGRYVNYFFLFACFCMPLIIKFAKFYTQKTVCKTVVSRKDKRFRIMNLIVN